MILMILTKIISKGKAIRYILFHQTNQTENLYRTLPTKSDIDAFRAISNVSISESEYPHVHKWKLALERFNQNQFPEYTQNSSLQTAVLMKAKNAFKLF